MDNTTILNIVLGAINAVFLIYSGLKRLKPEVKKMDAEGDFKILEGAKISNQMLIDRINDLESQLEQERKDRKEELQQERVVRAAELEKEKESRKKESEYLRRRIREAEREARDYRHWAAKLAKQVIDSGRTPAQFIPSSLEDSDPSMLPIRTESGDDSK